MVLSIRPSIGWLGYFFIGKSPMRAALMLGIFGVLSVFLLKRSQESLSLQYSTPPLGGSAVIFLPPPTYASFNSFDACAVESASIVSEETIHFRNEIKNQTIYLYVWYSTVQPGDMWLKFLAQLKGVKIFYINLVKSLKNTPIEGMVNSGGWGGRPNWAVWIASGGSLLWRSGGILMPTGILMTKPLVVEAFGTKSGVLVVKNNKVYPIAIGSPPRHAILRKVLNAVQDFNHTLYDNFRQTKSYETPLVHLLSKSVDDVCNDDTNHDFRQSEKCSGFSVIARDSVYDINLEKSSSANEEGAAFLRFTGDPQVLKTDLVQSIKFFRKHALLRFCPKVYNYLLSEAKELL